MSVQNAKAIQPELLDCPYCGLRARALEELQRRLRQHFPRQPSFITLGDSDASRYRRPVETSGVARIHDDSVIGNKKDGSGVETEGDAKKPRGADEETKQELTMAARKGDEKRVLTLLLKIACDHDNLL